MGLSIRRALVLVSCCLAAMVGPGLLDSQGEMFVIIMHRFSANRAETATIQSLFVGTVFISGFVHGLLIQRFGTRVVGFFGGLLAAIACFVSSFATSIVFLVISVGIFEGIGIGASIVVTLTAVGQHFAGSKYSSIALSVLSTSGAVGAMCYPFLITFLDDKYGLPGIYIILSSSLLHICPASLFWTTPDNVSEDQKEDICILDREGDNKAYHIESPEELQTIDKDVQDHNKNIYTVCNDTKHISTDTVCTAYIFEGEKIDVKKRTKPSRLCKNSAHALYTNEVDIGAQKRIQCQNVSDNKPTPTNSLKHLGKKCHFWAYTIGLASAMSGLLFIPIFIVDILTDKGIPEAETPFYITLFNGLSLCGRLALGFLMKIHILPVLSFPSISTFGGAITMTILAVTVSQPTITVSICIAGFFFGIIVSTIGAITVEIFGTEHCAASIGIVCTMNGILGSITGPLAGYLRDQTNYNVVLFSGSGLCVIGAGFFVCSHIVQTRSTVIR